MRGLLASHPSKTNSAAPDLYCVSNMQYTTLPVQDSIVVLVSTSWYYGWLNSIVSSLYPTSLEPVAMQIEARG
jgi:hypothetical protein